MLDLDVHWQRGFFRLGVKCQLSAGITGLVGRSGAGKTSLLHLLAGLERPSFGRIVIDGDVLFDHTARIHVPAHRRRTALVFQEARLFPHLRVEANLRYGLRAAATTHPGVRFDDVVEWLGLRPLLSRRASELSGGEQRRVALGRALLSAPRLLLLDEPLAGLDAESRRRVLPYLRRTIARPGVPIIYVAHDLREILALTDRILLLDQGRVAGCGPLTTLLHDAETFEQMRSLGMENVLPARVIECRPEDGLARLELEPVEDGPPPPAAPPTVLAPLASRRLGERVRFALRPADIALSTRPIEGISIQNRLLGRVTRVTAHPRVTLVEINAGRPFLAEISARSATELQIAAGRSVFMLFKSQAVQYVDADEL